jgi:hypothetical protein
VYVAVSPISVLLLTIGAYLGGSNMDNPLLLSVVLFTFSATVKAALDGLTYLDRKKSDYNDWFGPIEELKELAAKALRDVASGAHNLSDLKNVFFTLSRWRVLL